MTNQASERADQWGAMVAPLAEVVGTMKDLMWSFLARYLDINVHKMNIW